MKEILDQMEEHIAEIRNLQRNFDFHSRRLERLMKDLTGHHQKAGQDKDREEPQLQGKS